jgi:thioredoxin reductase
MTGPAVAVLGAGPIGLDAALACAGAGLEYTVYEAGPGAGTHPLRWGHVRLFTPWSMNLSTRMRALLPDAPDGAGCPSGRELAEAVLRPLASAPPLAGRIRTRHRVRAIGRRGLLKHEQISTPERAAAPFRLLVDTPDGERVDHADVVLDCTGTYSGPNLLGDGRIPALGEPALDDQIVREIPRCDDEPAWQGTLLLVGAGKSAQTAAAGLARLPGTRVHWVVRAPDPDWGEVVGDPLPARQELVGSSRALAAGENPRVLVHTGRTVAALRPDGRRIQVRLDPTDEFTVDHVIALTGYVGDAGLYRQLQVHECYATAAPMNLSATLLAGAGNDCLAQPAAGLDALRTPEPGFFVLGAKSYGRLTTFLLRTGYEQVDQVIGGLAGA